MTYALVAIFGTMILSQVGVNIAPIIASAGILGGLLIAPALRLFQFLPPRAAHAGPSIFGGG